MKSILIASLLFTSVSTSSLAQDAVPRISEIAANGTTQVKVVPDRAILTVTVETRSNSASAAAAENARIVAATMQSLRASGVKDAELSNGRYTITQDFENGDRRKFRGFVAQNSIRVEVPAVTDVGKLIDASLAGGATLVSPIQYMGPDMQNARREALKTAVAEARRDAEALAEASGGSLGRLLSMTTAGNMAPQAVVLSGSVVYASGGIAAPPTSIRPSDLVVVGIANGRWEFVPRR
jgi:uncharacterized protein YggE